MSMNAEEFVKGLEVFGIKAAIAAGILIAGTILLKIVKRYVKKILVKKIEESICDFLLSLFSVLIWIFIVTTCFAVLGVPITTIAAVVGSAGLAVALALKDSLTNLASGIFIIINKPFKKGDFIDASDVSGTVEEVKLLTTLIDTIDNKKVVMPNKTLANANIVNYNNHRRMININLPVSYGADIEHLRSVMLDCLNGLPVLSDPAPFVKVHEYDEGIPRVILRAWTKTEDYWSSYWTLNERLLQRLKEEGIGMPYKKLLVALESEREK